jgi:paraquat-inducible protein B
MSQKANLTAIGGFVIFTLALVVAAVIYFGSGAIFKKAESKAVAFFPGSIRGLSVGSEVLFRGVKMGEVTNIEVLFSAAENRYEVAVYLKTYQDLVTVIDDDLDKVVDHVDVDEAIKKYGLKAQMVSKSLITGQQAIEVDFMPDKSMRLVGLAPEEYKEIPTVKGDLQQLKQMIEGLDLQKLQTTVQKVLRSFNNLIGNPEIGETIHQAKLGLQDARVLVNNANKTVEDLRPSAVRLLSQADTALKTADSALSELKPTANKALQEIDKTFQTARNMIDDDSITRQNIDRALESLTQAAEAVRNLAEYINQNPDALFRGRNR